MTTLTLPWTRQGRFLRALAKSGCVARACRVADLDRRLAYRWRERDTDFARRWKAAAARGTDLIRDELMERALVGRERLVYRYRPTSVHRDLRREIFGPPARQANPGDFDLAERLRQGEARVARYEAENGVSFSDTHSKK